MLTCGKKTEKIEGPPFKNQGIHPRLFWAGTTLCLKLRLKTDVFPEFSLAPLVQQIHHKIFNYPVKLKIIL